MCCKVIIHNVLYLYSMYTHTHTLTERCLGFSQQQLRLTPNCVTRSWNGLEFSFSTPCFQRVPLFSSPWEELKTSSFCRIVPDGFASRMRWEKKPCQEFHSSCHRMTSVNTCHAVMVFNCCAYIQQIQQWNITAVAFVQDPGPDSLDEIWKYPDIKYYQLAAANSKVRWTLQLIW